MTEQPTAAPPPGDGARQASPEPSALVRPIEMGIFVAVLVADQVTKMLIQRALLPGESVPVIPKLLDLTHVHNSGAAFGLLNAADFPYKPVVMIGIGALALAAIGVYAAQLGFHERVARLGLSLILGGAFGNLIDRARAGYVVDFVDVYWGTTHFWAFNVADAAITIGAVMVLLDMLGLWRRHASHPV